MTYEYEGKTEKEAIEKAVSERGLERDQFDVEILETQKNSLFKKGFVKIRVHTEDSAVSSLWQERQPLLPTMHKPCQRYTAPEPYSQVRPKEDLCCLSETPVARLPSFQSR